MNSVNEACSRGGEPRGAPDGMATLSEREGKRARESPREPIPCLDRLLLLFWAHCIKDSPRLLTKHGFTVDDYLLQTTKERMLLITSKRRMLQIKGKSG